MRPTEAGPALVRFGRFELQPHRRELLADGVQVQLGSRAFDVLVALIEGRGELVTKDELLARVWSGMVVEDGNLQVQVSTLRKVFGEDRDFIRTIPGRGYRFVADITTVAASRDTAADEGPATAGSPPPPTNLPATASHLIGREAELAEVVELISAHRLVTLTGAGGSAKAASGSKPGATFCRRFPMGYGSPSSPLFPSPISSRPPSRPRSGSSSLPGLYRPGASPMRSAQNSCCSCSTIASM